MRFLCLFLVLLHSASVAQSLPASITIALQPSRVGDTQSGPLNSKLFTELLKLNTDVQIFLCPWARCLKAIETGAADIISDLYYSDERANYTVFLSPHYDVQDTAFRFIVHKDANTSITSWDDLYEIGIGTVRGSVYFPRFDSDTRLNKYPTVHISNTLELLLKKRIQAVIAPPTLTNPIIGDYDPTGQLTIAEYNHQYTQKVFIGLSKQSDWLPFKQLLEQRLLGNKPLK